MTANSQQNLQGHRTPAAPPPRKPASSPEVTDLSEAATLLYGGRYELLDLVGAGGAGTVYRARDIELDEIVALKVLRKELLGASGMLENFRSEVKLARRVTHRNVARMFDIGEQDGERFLTMEFVEGEMLTAKINSGPDGSPRPLPLAQVQDVMEQVCAGLTAAHTVGIIHRDLKPDNIMVGRDGRIVITDFGIARALQGSGSSDQNGEFIGTPEYMSPEQAEGGAIDARTDIYSLGIVLYEMVTGTLPFSTPNPLTTAAARLLRPPPDPRTRRPGLPDAIAQVILRCMAKSQQDRYPTAADLASAVGDAIRTATGSFELVPMPASARSGKPPGPITVSGPLTSAFEKGERRESTPTLSGSLSPAADSAAQHSIAVLPFRNQGPAEDAYLADGLTDDLIDGLSMIPSLRVRSRGAVMAQLRTINKDVPDPAELGQALGVEVLVDGAVRRAGSALRISARLLSRDGTQLWAQRLDRPAADALAVSDEVAQALVGALLNGQAMPQRAVMKDADAVDLYLRGRALYGAAGPDNLAEAIKLFERALALRPEDPMLLCANAMARAKLWFFDTAAEQGALARTAAERAITLAPERPESHLAMAMVCFYAGDAAGSLRHAKATLQRQPNQAEALDLVGRVLAETGPVSSAMRYMERAYELDALAMRRSFMDRARIKVLTATWAESEALLDEAQRAGLSAAAVWFTRSRLAGWIADPQLAKTMLEHPDITSGKYPRVQSILRLIMGDSNQNLDAIFTGTFGSDQSSPRSRAYFFQLKTEVECLHGHTDAAIRALARSVDAGLFDLVWVDHCPLLSGLRKDLRYQALRKIIAERARRIQEVLRQ